jgi:hypothetical protein
MNTFRFCYTLLAAALTGMALFVTLARADGPLCHWKSQTPPPALEGNVGNSASDEYWFTHISDVDSEGTLKHFVYDIDNNHPSNSLPAEWRQSDGTIRIEFHNIKPGKCGSSDFRLSNPPSEDPNAYINYGPIKQNQKTNAALYIPGPKPSTNTPVVSAPPELKSRIIADLQRGEGEAEHLELEFATKTEGTNFSYTVINHGSQKVFFNIPELFDKLEKIQGVDIKSRWSSEGDKLVASPDRPQTYAVQLAKEVGFQETQVLLEVTLPTSGTEAAGQVTVYFPLEAK